MIQRQQTLWLILATLAALFCFMFPFATGKGLEKGLVADKEIKAGSDFLLLIATGASLILFNFRCNSSTLYISVE